jgi:RNA polymerase sigma-70 factor (ECF subfamily)
MRPLTVTYEDEGFIRAAADDAAAKLLDTLPADQREAVHAHVVAGEPYRAMARRLGTPESVLRKRVSRGLRELRSRLEAPR